MGNMSPGPRTSVRSVRRAARRAFGEHRAAMQRVAARASSGRLRFKSFRRSHIGASIRLYLSRAQFHASGTARPTISTYRRSDGYLHHDHEHQDACQLGAGRFDSDCCGQCSRLTECCDERGASLLGPGSIYYYCYGDLALLLIPKLHMAYVGEDEG